MEMVTDFLLLAASGTACLYCLILSRRLKGLTSMKGGLGAGIAALSRSAEEMKKAIGDTKRSADASAERLEAAISHADRKAEQLRGLIAELGEMEASVINHAEGATRKYVDTLAPILGEANDAAERLFAAIESAPVVTPFPPASRKKAPSAKKRARAGEAA
ncbi:MAG: hypothetical protein GC153_13615 [Alphaproteobacteria bacterium]|nr:hypothetical protein [Alphaproteobacteria bacterium]